MSSEEESQLGATPALTHKKTRQNLEELLLYYQVEECRLSIELLRRRLAWGLAHAGTVP